METKTVNTIPEGMSAMFHASQGDNGDTKTVCLTEELAGTETLVLRYVKPNDEIGATVVPSVSGTDVVITITSDMTDVPGIVYCVLRVNGNACKCFGLMIEGRP